MKNILIVIDKANADIEKPIVNLQIRVNVTVCNSTLLETLLKKKNLFIYDLIGLIKARI